MSLPKFEVSEPSLSLWCHSGFRSLCCGTDLDFEQLIIIDDFGLLETLSVRRGNGGNHKAKILSFSNHDCKGQVDKE